VALDPVEAVQETVTAPVEVGVAAVTPEVGFGAPGEPEFVDVDATEALLDPHPLLATTVKV
jgi:hypothetical protein